ncbi:MAG: nuclease [bacterium]|nr:nuclease [bacterium]
MPELRRYSLFISHAWKYGDAYDRLVALLDDANYFRYLNWSAPEDKPIIPPGAKVPDKEIESEIERKISFTHCVLVIAGMYAAHSDWMQVEIDIAKKLKVPMVGIRPRGNNVMPTEVLLATKVDVGWTTDSIVAAIQQWALSRKS